MTASPFESTLALPSETALAESGALEAAILRTVAYGDIFDYPLTPREIHRYLVGVGASRRQVAAALSGRRLLGGALCFHEGFVTLPGREGLVEARRRRAQVARRLWPEALAWGRRMAALPFVRMVAVTGALAVANCDEGADLDYLVVTEPGRLWLCRAMIVLLARAAALRGVTLCPNYLVSEEALLFHPQNLYTAHEVVQMVPIAGLEKFARLRRLNSWTLKYLPNAAPPPLRAAACRKPPVRHRSARLLEGLLRAPLTDRLERWEMARKSRRFARQADGTGEASFCAEWCKGHFAAHAARTLGLHRARLQGLGLPLEDPL